LNLFVVAVPSAILQFTKSGLGNLITSQGEAVWDTIQQHFPATVELAVFSMAIALIVGISVGVLSARAPNSFWTLSDGCSALSLTPWLHFGGMLMQLLVQLRWFPLRLTFSPHHYYSARSNGIIHNR